jgi:hypothetical protein
MPEDGARLIQTDDLMKGIVPGPGQELTVSDLVVSVGTLSRAVGAEGGWMYTPAPDWHGVVRFDFLVSSSGADPRPGSATLTIDAVNDAPLVALPVSQTVPSGGGRLLPGIQVTDVEGDLLRAVLSVKLGTLAIDLSSGPTILEGANASGMMVLQGTPEQLQAALAGQ